ncbi:succinylglutamate desuccinylase/aspartoacylase family protein [Aestuariivirga sp.]|uniref:succinylglutamate desuccinylase/aspartoacylase family protein n=1 Tax=Aestuariivirga sp. TaxID=2650926 RepID=UPI0039E32A04
MKPFRIGDHQIAAGSRAIVDLPVSALSTHTRMNLPVHVLHGEKKGPVFFISGVVHGDEIQGVEIVRRLLQHQSLVEIRGTLLAAPIVNSFGFMNHTRYMPDRRDLNRSFPGSDRGSLASLLADLFFREVVLRCQYGIDLHTAALHRTNLPQVRVAPGDPELLALAEAFAPPVILVSKLREKSLRLSAKESGVKVLLYEGGEALRFDEQAIDAGVKGCLRVMEAVGMITEAPRKSEHQMVAVSTASSWVRAPEGGILHTIRRAGDRVGKQEVIGVIADPLGAQSVPVVAEDDGIIVGRTNLPLANRGDALFHIARVKPKAGVKAREQAAPLFDEDEII